jgi:hypothetical protein
VIGMFELYFRPPLEHRNFIGKMEEIGPERELAEAQRSRCCAGSSRR